MPDAVVACVGGGSNAIGIFHAFLDDPGVRLVGYEAAGDGVETGRHAATFTGGSPGAFQGSFSYLLQDEDGQTIESHSISAGLDYPGVGPEHAWLKETGRAEYQPITDSEAMDAFRLLCRTEGIIPAIESAHAVAGALKLGAELGSGAVIVVNLSGRGDKDVETAAKWFGLLDDRCAGDRNDDVEQSATSRLGPLFESCREDNRAALDRLSAHRLPRRADVDARDDRTGRIRLRHHRSRRAVLRSGHGRSDHRERPPRPRCAGECESATRWPRSRRSAAAGGRAVVMTYWNPVLRYGVDAFARDLASAGGHGLITPDLIPDEAAAVAGGIGGAPVGPHLPGGAVIDAATIGDHGRGVARIRLRGVDDGRDRGARRGVARRT